MRISSVEEFELIETLDGFLGLEQVHQQFPFGIIVECDYPEWDFAQRWCWQKYGPRHGECWSQLHYATCPLILATEYTVEVRVWGKDYHVKRYLNVDRHYHDGTWTNYWFCKTDYDHGFGEFCFSRADDLERFREFVPLVDWGENFPWLREEQTE